jgi:hypothetical protein
MRTLSEQEIEQVGGGLDTITIGGVTISGIEAGLALRNIAGQRASHLCGLWHRHHLRTTPTRDLGASLGTDIIYNASEQSW